MRKLQFINLLVGILFILPLQAQEVLLSGYIYESGNRGYLNAVHIQIKDQVSKRLVAETDTNKEGQFSVPLSPGEYVIETYKDLFHLTETPISISTKKSKEFVKIQLHRKPGYIFDVTLAEKLIKGKEQVDAITNARIEVYNNTTQEPVLEMEAHPYPTFKLTFERGNHYTIMIRKEGYFTKRMEAYVDVKGCILCFEGVGDVRPDVSDVLTEQNQMGTLLANIELQPMILNEGFELKNIYYDLNSAQLRPEAEKELEALVTILKDNPGISVELGSHTDARGKDAYNLQLSQKRAQSVVNYLYETGQIEKARLLAKGYGETQLINDCTNSKKCAEKKHQENRRTELTVTSIELESTFRDMRLAEIIQLESISNEIVEVGQDGQIMVQTGEDLPADIQRDIEQTMQRETVSTSSKTNQSRNTPTTVATASTAANNTTIEAVPPKAVAIPTARPIKKTTTSTVKDSAPSTNTSSHQENAGETLVKVASKKRKTTYPPPPSRANQPATTAASSTITASVSDTPITTPTGESIVKHPIKTGKTRSVATNFTGYQIEFLLANGPVAKKHPIFSQHGNILLEERESGEYAYLLGNFKQKKDATIFLNEVILPRYPTAKLVYYMKGQRIGYAQFSTRKGGAMPPR